MRPGRKENARETAGRSRGGKPRAGSPAIEAIRLLSKWQRLASGHVMLGGFHLGLAKPEYLQHSLRELEALDPDVIIPMHCTGAPFIEMMRGRMPGKLVYSNVGSRFSFGV